MTNFFLILMFILQIIFQKRQIPNNYKTSFVIVKTASSKYLQKKTSAVRFFHFHPNGIKSFIVWLTKFNANKQ